MFSVERLGNPTVLFWYFKPSGVLQATREHKLPVKRLIDIDNLDPDNLSPADIERLMAYFDDGDKVMAAGKELATLTYKWARAGMTHKDIYLVVGGAVKSIEGAQYFGPDGEPIPTPEWLTVH